MAKIFLALLFFMPLLLFQTEKSSAAEKIFPFKYQVKRLNNGLTIIMVPLPYPGLVAYYSVVRTGSRDEWEPGHSGFAHFFEHMMFRGTEKYPSHVYDRIVTEIGADANAYTTYDYTCYHLVFGRDDLEKVMELESDRFQNLSYGEEAFKTEAGAVYGEYLKGRTNPWSVLLEKLHDTAFDKHTYKHTVIGFKKDIEAMPGMYGYSKTFFQRYYRPESVAILITGDFDPEEAGQLAKKYYGGWESGYVEPRITPEPPQEKGRQANVSYPGETLPILSLSYKGPAFSPKEKDPAACQLLGELAFGENSDLFKKLVLEEQKVESIDADFSLFRDPGLLSIFSMVKKEEDIPYVEEEIEKTIEAFQKKPVEKERLEKEKKRKKYSFLMNLDTTERIASSLARIIALTGGIDAIEDLYQRYEEITPADILAAFRKYFRPESQTNVVLKGKGTSSQSPEPKGETVPAVLLPVKDDPSIVFRIWFKVGSQNDPPGKEGLCSLAAAMLTRGGTRSRSYDEILSRLYPLAAAYAAQVDREMTVIAGRVHEHNLAEFYGLLREALLEPGFREEDFKRLKDNALNELENKLRYANDEELGKAALYHFIFQRTRYAHPETGLVQSVRSISLEDVRKFYEEHFTRNNVVAGLGGCYTDGFVGRVCSDLASLPDGKPVEASPPEPESIDGLDVLIVEKECNATAISLGFPIDVLRGSRDFYALFLANSWFGEHRNSFSHLYQVIREARGLNYGDYSYIECFPEGGFRQFPPQNVARRRQIFEIWIRPVPNEARLFSLRAALRELHELVDKGMTPEAFELAKNFLKKYSLHFAPTTSAQLGYKMDDLFYGLAESHLENFAKRIDSLTLDEVNSAIRKHLKNRNLKVVFVTNEGEALKKELLENAPSPITYKTPKSGDVLAEDKEIERYPIPVRRVTIVQGKTIFEK